MPPDELDRPLEIDPAEWDSRQTYFFLAALVIPRPIAWISTLSKNGVPNLSPFSYFTIASNSPPHVVFSSTGIKDTVVNARDAGEFVVNIVDQSQVDAMVQSSIDLPPEMDEFAWAGIEPAGSKRVAAPRVKAARAHLECQTRQIIPVGESWLVIGEVVHLQCSEKVWARGRIQPDLLDPVCRLSGSGYATLGEIYSRQPPKYAKQEEPN
jgi:flavin reductase (DIM6/NTAB) family NADH-FMN oxidoreductase RutF